MVSYERVHMMQWEVESMLANTEKEKMDLTMALEESLSRPLAFDIVFNPTIYQTPTPTCLALSQS